jgi:hypothetical protein
MSYNYHLVCFETKESLNLGKIITQDVFNPIPIQFSGFGMDLLTGKTLDKSENWQLVERFLIRNRGKEIRLIPFDSINSADPDFQNFNLIDSLPEYLAEPVEDKDYLEEVESGQGSNSGKLEIIILKPLLPFLL